jgi:molybdate transport system substrate-binding protein
LLLLSCAAATSAAELKVLGAEAFKPAFEAVAVGFQQATGHKIHFVYATAGVLRDRIRAGETADVIILPKPTFDPLQAEGRIARDGSASIAQSLFSLAVPAGASKPDIGTVDALKRALLNDPRIELVGPLPAELQSPTEFVFSAGLGPQTVERAAAQALIRYLLGPEALAVLRSKGLDTL